MNENRHVECVITSTFSIESATLDPDQWTVALGLEPSEIGRIGTKRTPESYGVLLTSFWSLGPHRKPGDDIDDGMQEVLEAIWPVRTKIVELLKEPDLSAAFTTTVSIYTQRPLYRLRAETLRKMAYFGIEYIFDVHDYSD